MEAHRAETPLASGSVHDSRPEGRAQHQQSTLSIFRLKTLVFQDKKLRPEQTGGFMSRDDKDTVYCNIQMPMAKERELCRLVAELRSSGNHSGLESVFKEIQDELDSSIEFVEEQLRGEGGFGRGRS